MGHSCFRIYDTNFIDIDILANQDFSSEQAAFPAVNVYNTQRRSKVFRTNGYYAVDSTNKVIIFKEASAVQLTATIAESNYQSTAAFMAAVVVALNAAGASTYSMVQTNLKFVITSNGVGGDGRFELDVTDGSFTAEGILGLSGDKTGSLVYTSDFVVIHSPNEFLLWDLGVPTNPSAFILVGLRNESLPYSPGATLLLEGNETNDFSSPSFSQAITYDDEVLSVISDENLASAAFRYWRFSIVDQTNGKGYIQISNVFLGSYFDPLRGRVTYPWNKGYVDPSISSRAEGGQVFVDTKQQTGQYNILFFNLEKADIERFDEIYAVYGKTNPIFVSMDTAEAFSTNRNRRIIFARFEGQPQVSLASPDRFNLTLSFTEDL